MIDRSNPDAAVSCGSANTEPALSDSCPEWCTLDHKGYAAQAAEIGDDTPAGSYHSGRLPADEAAGFTVELEVPQQGEDPRVWTAVQTDGGLTVAQAESLARVLLDGVERLRRTGSH